MILIKVKCPLVGLAFCINVCIILHMKDVRGVKLEKGDSIIILPEVMPKRCKEGIYSHYSAIEERIFFLNLESGRQNRAYPHKVIKVPPRP
jgi:hypothetical protein